jgi:hypothetical protein
MGDSVEPPPFGSIHQGVVANVRWGENVGESVGEKRDEMNDEMNEDMNDLMNSW